MVNRGAVAGAWSGSFIEWRAERLNIINSLDWRDVLRALECDSYLIDNSSPPCLFSCSRPARGARAPSRTLARPTIGFRADSVNNTGAPYYSPPPFALFSPPACLASLSSSLLFFLLATFSARFSRSTPASALGPQCASGLGG